ncbi:sperm acrosome membrane-associated protein 6 isoform X2 [Erinaceus europaeus]|uniref:Sperm acrosome membrane-associated protein 6 isoform X2 n=3 Tax=Erinaceus europaeus TaxID=9365 RepID=A0ABM3W4G7_ERIEU|nr:sperm acrosome membrane-associated protein 6 isoform X2 [Erinaceus europaeus]
MAPVAPASKVPSALGVLAALGVPAWACLLCFTDYEDRLRICHIFAGREGPELHRCREALTNAFKVLQDTEINYEERAHLHDTFSQMTHSLEEIATAQGSFEVAFPDAVEKVQKVIMQLKEAPPCIPPCGLQEASRRFRCRGCYSALCDLPLDCPVQDVTVTRGHQALFSCTVDFPLPKEEISYSWKFAAGASDPGPDVLPRLTALERVPGAHPAGAARAPGHLLLRDRSRPEAAGAALLLPERDRPAPAQGDQAAGRLPGRAALGAAGGGGDGALEAQPGRAAGLARGPDAPKPAPDGRPGGLRSRLCHHAGMVVYSMVLQRLMTKDFRCNYQHKINTAPGLRLASSAPSSQHPLLVSVPVFFFFFISLLRNECFTFKYNRSYMHNISPFNITIQPPLGPLSSFLDLYSPHPPTPVSFTLMRYANSNTTAPLSSGLWWCRGLNLGLWSLKA